MIHVIAPTVESDNRVWRGSSTKDAPALTQALPKLESPSRGKPAMSLWKCL
jgi:hypothetical protein